MEPHPTTRDKPPKQFASHLVWQLGSHHPLLHPTSPYPSGLSYIPLHPTTCLFLRQLQHLLAPIHTMYKRWLKTAFAAEHSICSLFHTSIESKIAVNYQPKRHVLHQLSKLKPNCKSFWLRNNSPAPVFPFGAMWVSHGRGPLPSWTHLWRLVSICQFAMDRTSLGMLHYLLMSICCQITIDEIITHVFLE